MIWYCCCVVVEINDEPIWSEAGEILAKLRRASKISQSELADWSQRYGTGSFSVRTLGRWEKGHALPSIEQLYTLTLVLRLEPDTEGSEDNVKTEVAALMNSLWVAVRKSTKKRGAEEEADNVKG